MEYVIAKRKLTAGGGTDWAAVSAAPIDRECWGTGRPDIHAEAKVCCDEEKLYVRLSSMENDIRAEETGFYGMPCRDSCLEFFFAPASDDRYFNIEFNPNCAMFLGYGTGPDALCRLQTGAIPKMIFDPVTERFDGGWQIAYSVPYSFIRIFFPDFSPKEGFSMRGNFYKCGDDTVKTHFYSWHPMPEDNKSFHNPKAFGKLIFA